MQKPSKGRVVLIKVDPSLNNGAPECPAIVTRAWGAGPDGIELVNVRELRDSADSPQWRTSVKLFDSEEEARAHDGAACFWPPRV